MMNDKPVTVTLSEPMADEIRGAVDSGAYASINDAVMDAVRLWSEQRQFVEPDLENLRQAWDAGKASGTYGPLDFDDLRLEARTHLASAIEAKRAD